MVVRYTDIYRYWIRRRLLQRATTYTRICPFLAPKLDPTLFTLYWNDIDPRYYTEINATLQQQLVSSVPASLITLQVHPDDGAVVHACVSSSVQVWFPKKTKTQVNLRYLEYMSADKTEEKLRLIREHVRHPDVPGLLFTTTQAISNVVPMIGPASRLIVRFDNPLTILPRKRTSKVRQAMMRRLFYREEEGIDQWDVRLVHLQRDQYEWSRHLEEGVKRSCDVVVIQRPGVVFQVFIQNVRVGYVEFQPTGTEEMFLFSSVHWLNPNLIESQRLGVVRWAVYELYRSYPTLRVLRIDGWMTEMNWLIQMASKWLDMTQITVLDQVSTVFGYCVNMDVPLENAQIYISGLF